MLKYEKSIALLRTQVDDCKKMVLEDDMKCMKRVLRRLGFIDKNDIVQLKGKVACEISACDEIIATELIFSGVFNEMEPNAISALLTCLVHDERTTDNIVNLKNEALSKALLVLLDHAKRVFKVFQDSKLNVEETEYLATFKPQLMELTYAWCNGATFSEICKMADVYEGTIIRCLRRLDELLKQFAEAAKSIGNNELEAKFGIASKNLKRGIVFTASLYL